MEVGQCPESRLCAMRGERLITTGDRESHDAWLRDVTGRTYISWSRMGFQPSWGLPMMSGVALAAAATAPESHRKTPQQSAKLPRPRQRRKPKRRPRKRRRRQGAERIVALLAFLEWRRRKGGKQKPKQSGRRTAAAGVGTARSRTLAPSPQLRPGPGQRPRHGRGRRGRRRRPRPTSAPTSSCVSASCCVGKLRVESGKWLPCRPGCCTRAATCGVRGDRELHAGPVIGSAGPARIACSDISDGQVTPFWKIPPQKADIPPGTWTVNSIGTVEP